MIFGNVLFFVLIFVCAVYIFFIKGQGEFLQRYLSFLVITSFFFAVIFDVMWVTWLTLLCAIGLLIHLKLSAKKTIVFILFAVIYFAIYRVPTNPNDFETFLQDEQKIICAGNTCVKVKEVIVQGHLQIQTNTYTINEFSFKWYTVFAVGEAKIDSQVIRAINIAGYWILLT